MTIQIRPGELRGPTDPPQTPFSRDFQDEIQKPLDRTWLETDTVEARSDQWATVAGAFGPFGNGSERIVVATQEVYQCAAVDTEDESGGCLILTGDQDASNVSFQSGNTKPIRIDPRTPYYGPLPGPLSLVATNDFVGAPLITPGLFARSPRARFLLYRKAPDTLPKWRPDRPYFATFAAPPALLAATTMFHLPIVNRRSFDVAIKMTAYTAGNFNLLVDGLFFQGGIPFRQNLQTTVFSALNQTTINQFTGPTYDYLEIYGFWSAAPPPAAATFAMRINVRDVGY